MKYLKDRKVLTVDSDYGHSGVINEKEPLQTVQRKSVADRYPPVALGRPHAREDGEKPQPMETLHWSRLLAGTAACEEEFTQRQVSLCGPGNPFLKDYTQ